MSSAGLSTIRFSSLSPVQATSPLQSRRTDFQQLSQSLQSGDLSGAQQAYTALANLNAGGAGQFSQNSQLAQDFGAVGQALQSGDLAGAQQSFATLKQDLQAARASRSNGSQGGGGSNQSGGESVSNPGGGDAPNLPTSSVDLWIGRPFERNPGGGGGGNIPTSSTINSPGPVGRQPISSPGGGGGGNLPTSSIANSPGPVTRPPISYPVTLGPIDFPVVRVDAEGNQLSVDA